MNLDNEELYFTKRLNGSITDEDIEKAKEIIIKQINVFGLKQPNYDTAIWLPQIQVETIINELKYKEEKIKELEENYIEKSLVREKIEKAKKEIKQMEQDDIGVGFTLGNRWSDLKAKVKGWEEILQEGDTNETKM